MKKTDLNNVFSVSLRLFTIIKEEYYNYLSNDKKEFLDKLDVFHLELLKIKNYLYFLLLEKQFI